MFDAIVKDSDNLLSLRHRRYFSIPKWKTDHLRIQLLQPQVLKETMNIDINIDILIGFIINIIYT